MEINKRFEQLERPSKDYLGEPLDHGKFSRDIYLAKNKEGKNCFLIRVQSENKHFRAPDLKDIHVIYQVKCSIETKEGLDIDDFTIIEFTADDSFKQELFFSQMQSIFEKIEFPCKTSKISSLEAVEEVSAFTFPAIIWSLVGVTFPVVYLSTAKTSKMSIDFVKCVVLVTVKPAV